MMSNSNRRKFITTTGLASFTGLLGLGLTEKAVADPRQSERPSEILNFDDIPVADHNHHDFNVDLIRSYDASQFAAMFYHGAKDDGSKLEKYNELSKSLKYNISQLGIVIATVTELSRLFGCADTLEAVNEERAARARIKVEDYPKMLYDKAKIKTVVLDIDGTHRNTAQSIVPGKIFKVVQADYIFDECLKASSSIADLRKMYIERIAGQLANKQYIAVKSGVVSRAGLKLGDVILPGSKAVLDKARKGDARAMRKIYIQSFHDLCLYCSDKGIAVHISTGSTGSLPGEPAGQVLNPLLLVPYLQRPELSRLKVVLLHGGSPWIQNAALMAYNFPNVYVDMSWVFPWNVLAPNNYLGDFLSIAPLSKIFYGSGCHTGPEIAYMGAILLKKALSTTFTNFVNQGFFTERRAIEVAHMILHKNVETFYNI